MKQRIFNILTLLSLFIGILTGFYLNDFADKIFIIGDIYIKVLKLFIFPILFTSISYSIYKTSKERNNLILKTLLLFIIMFIISFIITSIIMLIFNPANSFINKISVWEGSITKFNIKDFFINLIPKNINDVFVNPKVFTIIIFSILFGKVLSYFDFSENIFNVVDQIKKIIFILLKYFMYITPLAIISLVSNTVKNYGNVLLDVGYKYILVALLSSVIVLFLVMILPVYLICKINPLTYIKKVFKIWLITLSTCSSSATLPYTIDLCNRDFSIPSNITDVVVPLGCTIHMCGGAVSFAILMFFNSSLYGFEINFLTYILMIFSALLINMAAPGIPNGGIVIGASYLALFNIPLGFIGFYSGIYKILDMMYTTLNVTGDISANLIINCINKQK